jgi:S-adenosyl-L-methionine hydrolase (adenosine-forming)
MPPVTDRPLITLTTDFGLSDHYVGTMKGVILSRCPEARIVDISHDLPAFDILSAAYTIDQAAAYFPPGTIHVVVVDPGVGTSRSALLVEAGNQRFIAPDNGVLSLIVERYADARFREITNRALFLNSVSATFHGRDVFSAVAGALASGAVESADVGTLLASIQRAPNIAPHRDNDGWRGIVLSVDHFGNVVTNLKSANFSFIDAAAFRLQINEVIIDSFYPTFGAAPRSIAFAYFGSSGYIEVGINQGRAASVLRAAPGSPLYLSPAQRTAFSSP